MPGKPCAFGTMGTETWAPLMNSGVYLAKRRNPSVILGCWLPVETWHCSQALKWIKKIARGKTGMQGQKGGTGNIERSGLMCLQREAKRKKPLSWAWSQKFTDLLSVPSVADVQTFLVEETLVHSVFPATAAGKRQHLPSERSGEDLLFWWDLFTTI